jgi:predicted O-methyltransferase YrrM
LVDHILAAFLDDLYRQGREHDAAKEDRLDRLRNVEPDTARLMAVLVRATRPRRMLELGTSNGYSTIWLADAARAVGAELVSVELDPARSEQARRNLESAGVADNAELRVADGGEVLAASPDEHWDFVFLDSERPAYTGYWPDLRRALAKDGLLVVDNVLSHADEVADFRELVAADPDVLEVVAPTGAGALLVVKPPA